MKTKKSGETVIQRETLAVKAWVHHQIANELKEVIFKFQESAELGLSAIYKNAEISTETALNFSQLLNKLRKIQFSQLRLALDCDEQFTEIRAGRPRSTKQRGSNLLSVIAGFKIKRKAGRPNKYGSSATNNNLWTYANVERLRKKMAENQERSTINAAIYSIVDEMAAESELPTTSDSRKKEFNSIRSAYIRGKKAST